MKKIVIQVIIYFCSFPFLFSQLERVEVEIHFRNGDTLNALMDYAENELWRYSNAIAVFDTSLANKEKIKIRQIRKIPASEIDYYLFKGKRFESHKVKFNNEILKGNNYSLLQKIKDGPISIYVGYFDSIRGIKNSGTRHKAIECTVSYFIKKRSNNVIENIRDIELKNWIQDCKVVYEKYLAGGYGNKKHKKGKDTRNRLMAKKESNNHLMIIGIISDYNEKIAWNTYKIKKF